jgi:hypothetical protein
MHVGHDDEAGALLQVYRFDSCRDHLVCPVKEGGKRFIQETRESIPSIWQKNFQ